MSHDPNPSARAVRALPARPSLEHLKNEAKQRLKVERLADPHVRLAGAQLALAREYGFASWRQLKAHVDTLDPARLERKRVFEAARMGDIDAVRRAFAAGFDPAAIDDDGRTIHQIAKAERHEVIELLSRDLQSRDTHAPEVEQIINAILLAAGRGKLAELGQLLDAHPDLLDASGGHFEKHTPLHRAAAHNQEGSIRLLLERGADVGIRDFPYNAYALHFAAINSDLPIVRLLVEAGSDIVGEGDDYEVGVLGWATCLRKLREDVAEYLLRNGAKLNFWCAIALDRGEDVRRFVARYPSLLSAHMTRNHHRRTALHHAAAKNRPNMVRLLLDLGADPNATDATGATPLTTASQENTDLAIVAMLERAGASLDFASAVNLKRYDLAEAMLRDDPARIGRDVVALHLAVSRKNVEVVRWLIEHGVDVNGKNPMWDCNSTALHMTIENGAIDIARMLLDAGADPNIRDDKYDATALGWAEFFCSEPFAQLIRERGGTR